MEYLDTIFLVGLIIFFSTKWMYKVAIWILIIFGTLFIGKMVWNLTVGEGETTLANVVSAIKACKIKGTVDEEER